MATGSNLPPVSAYHHLCISRHSTFARHPLPRRIQRSSTTIAVTSHDIHATDQRPYSSSVIKLELPESSNVDENCECDVDLNQSHNSQTLFSSERLESRKQLDWNQQLYVNLCRQMNLTPSQKFISSLLNPNVELRGLHLGISGAFACSNALASNANLRCLHLESNNLGNAGVTQLTNIITDNPFLHDLALINNNIGYLGLQSLVQAMSSNTSITTLNLSGNRFEERCGELIRILLEENRSIENLLLNNNNFREKGIVSIACGLAFNNSVIRLDLSWNHVRMRGCQCLSDCLKHNKCLRELNVGWNGFHIQGSRSLAKVLALNNTLEVLDLSCNRIDMNCLEILLKGLKKNTALKILKISQNPLTAEMIREFVTKIEDNKSVQIQQLDVTGLTVDPATIETVKRINEARQFEIIYGVILKNQIQDNDEEVFMNDDPMMVLMEFMKLKNMRLVDLFMSLDADGSKSLSHKEFREGLMTTGVPMSQICISRLIKVLDKDGDGEIDYSELIAGQKEHRRRLFKIQVQERHVPYDETELGQINLKLRKLLAAREKAKKEQLAAASVSLETEDRRPSLVNPGSRRNSVLPTHKTTVKSKSIKKMSLLDVTMLAATTVTFSEDNNNS